MNRQPTGWGTGVYNSSQHLRLACTSYNSTNYPCAILYVCSNEVVMETGCITNVANMIVMFFIPEPNHACLKYALVLPCVWLIYSSETSLPWLQIIHFILTTNNSLAGPGPPAGITVKAQSCHTLKVTWSSPDHTGGLPITGYNISYTDTLNNNILRGYSNTTKISLQQLKLGTEYIVRKLGTEYIVRVRATTPIGEGDLTQCSGRTSQRR